jgi:P-type Ca2+ transporter type 2C
VRAQSGQTATPEIEGRAFPRFAGLSADEAKARLRKYGPNRLVRPDRTAPLRELLRTLADPMALMLALASALYFWLGEARDGTVLAVALVPVLGVDVVMEARSRQALKKLASAVASKARVVRDGEQIEVASTEIVPGDLLVIREGDVVHADGIVRFAANLTLDESQLTGESEPQEKAPFNGDANAEAGERSRFYAGSLVVAGHGFGEVTATGERTRFGDIARLVAEADTTPTPLQRETSRMARWLIGAAIGLAACIFMARIFRNAPPSQAFLYAVSLAMSAVSEEFVLVFSLFLSLGAWRLGRIGVLVRRLASVETLGSTTVICLDKTGTLTAGSYALSTHQPLRDGISEDALLEAAVLACEPRPEDPIERAIIAHCRSHNVNVDELHSRWSLVHDYSFDPHGKHMSHVWARVENSDVREARIVAKGALEGVLEHCRLTADERERAYAANAELAAQGMRVLAVAGRFSSEPRAARTPDHLNEDQKLRAAGFSGAREEDERDLEMYGLLAFHDPLRPQVPGAVAECQSAGIKLKLITGDHALTAHAIAEAAGISHRDDLIFSGPELAHMSKDRFEQVVREASIFARVSPAQKYAIVDALVRAGEIVAMTGDGINDAPALRRSHIGVAMGRRGTEVARAAADLVLLDDDFGALVATVHEGRRVYSNIQHAFRYLIGFKFMLVGLALLAPLAGMPLLLMPVDLVWLELIVHPVSALAFEGDPGPNDLMRRPPRDPAAPIIPMGAALRSALSGAIITAAGFALFVMRLDAGEPYARGVAIALVIVGSLFLVWAEFAGDRPWQRVPFPRSLRFWMVCAGVAASLPAAMWAPSLAALVHIGPIATGDWAVVAAIAIASVIWRAWGIGSQPEPASSEGG